jgi:hypothetical protein
MMSRIVSFDWYLLYLWTKAQIPFLLLFRHTFAVVVVVVVVVIVVIVVVVHHRLTFV